MNKEFAYIASMKNSYSSKTKTNLLTNYVMFFPVIGLPCDLQVRWREGAFRFAAIKRVVVDEHLVFVKRRGFTAMC